MHWTPRLSRCQGMLTFIAIASLLLLSNVSSPVVFASAHASDKTTYGFFPKTFVATQRPNKQSLLIVLLDRSGSLTGPGGTDPSDYSTSVTRALTDLWPGKMVVITFPKVNPLVRDQVGQLGPYDLPTDSTQRQTLRNEIAEADPNGDTPLGPAMDRALSILQQGSVPAGSQAIIITDGLPNMAGDPYGTNEKNHIENDLLKQFHQLGVPISTFGLKITSPDAQSLLTSIAQRTGAHYAPVQSSTDLANQVIQLYASWFGLQFNSATVDQNGNYAVNINELTSNAKIIAFRSNEQYPITITAPDGSVLQQGKGVQQSLDTHYQIDTLDVTPPVVAGAYNVFVGKDPQAQVYWLVDTRLQVHITAPTSTGAIYTGTPPGKISAALFDGNNSFAPKPGAVLQAYVTFTAPGQTVATSEVDLTQQNGQDIFSGNAPIYNTVGTVQIVVKANYEEIHQQSNTETVKVEIPPCTSVSCFVERNLVLVSGGSILVLLLLVILIWFLLWRKQYPVTGYLVNARNERNALELGTYRPFLAPIFKKSVITMQELTQHPQGSLVVGTLMNEPLAFVVTDDGISLRSLDGDLPHIAVSTSKGVQKFSTQKREIALGNRSEILRNNTGEVIFQLTAPRRRSTV